MTDHIGDGTDGDVCQRSVDGNAAAIGMSDGNHAVHIGVLGQQLLFDALHCHLHHACSALHSGDDTQQIAGAGRTYLVAVAHPSSPGRGRQLVRGLDVGAPGHIGQCRAFRQVQHMLVDPAAGGDVVLCIAQHHAVADDLAAGGDIHQCDLVCLGDGIPGNHAALGLCACGQVVDGNHHIVVVFDLDGQTFCHNNHLIHTLMHGAAAR